MTRPEIVPWGFVWVFTVVFVAVWLVVVVLV
jgi:hypothetical protein